MPIALSPIEEALQQLSQGKMVILVENDTGEGEADLCLAADLTTPDGVNFHGHPRSWPSVFGPDRRENSRARDPHARAWA